ncbi:TPA: hypothetical protein ACSRFI_004072 [Clostridioides difficile]
MNLEARVKELEAELEKYKMRVEELEVELEKRKNMPKGGNTHKVPITVVNGDLNNSILSRRNLVNSLEGFMSKVENKVNRSGKSYKDWKKAMEFARKDKYIKKYAKEANVQITARNLERWYKYYVTNEIKLNTSKKK